ncbi:DUF397 domain-containing protein [Streptomyces sp. CAU 1734]|uniref:DUF397 domain-containing protein n=1 Tax=Streptomyces sp. CAU 1734 TaxID=3140360 RepID=UPI0032613425
MSGELVRFTSGTGGTGDSTCTEAAHEWHKSSYSASGAGQCVEVALHPRTVRVRDSKSVPGPEVGVGPGAWTVFVGYAARRAHG